MGGCACQVPAHESNAAGGAGRRAGRGTLQRPEPSPGGLSPAGAGLGHVPAHTRGCSSVTLLSDAPALAPRCLRLGCPPACFHLAPVSPACPAPILHPTALLAQSPPSLSAWLGTVLFLASAAVIWHLNVTRSLVANIYSSKIFKFQGL